MTSPEFATLTTDDLVTGEAVALDLPPAGVGSRMVSGLIDVAATIVVLILVIVIAALASWNADDALADVALIGTIVVVFVVVPTTIETLTRGKSLGKRILGLRTVRDDAGPISFQHALIRALVGFVEIYLLGGSPAFLSALVSARGKRLGDYAAGTYVVRERVKLRLAQPAAMPPHLANWADAADMGSLPTGLMLAVRQFLGRLPTIDPASRASIGGRLADEVKKHVAPAPPPGTTAEDFLAAVISSRRHRDLARLKREADFRDRLVSRH
jgi:uncharacterized RDD family membrane protein YckC